MTYREASTLALQRLGFSPERIEKVHAAAEAEMVGVMDREVPAGREEMQVDVMERHFLDIMRMSDAELDVNEEQFRRDAEQINRTN